VDYDDPGWAQVIKGLLHPWRFVLRGRIRAMNGLAALRLAYAGIVLSLWLYPFVLFMVQSDQSRSARGRAGAVATVVFVVSPVVLLLLGWIRIRPLQIDEPSGLAQSYRRSVFTGIGLSEVPALVAFIGSFFIREIWPYLLGAAVSTGALLWIAPGRRDIERRQHQIQEQGSPLSLGTALLQSPTRRS
jgi:hypothetical protein